MKSKTTTAGPKEVQYVQSLSEADKIVIALGGVSDALEAVAGSISEALPCPSCRRKGYSKRKKK